MLGWDGAYNMDDRLARGGDASRRREGLLERRTMRPKQLFVHASAESVAFETLFEVIDAILEPGTLNAGTLEHPSGAVCKGAVYTKACRTRGIEASSSKSFLAGLAAP